MGEREPLFSAKNKMIIREPLGKNNPITIQVLGICSALAVTSKLRPSIVMGIAVITVMAFSGFTVSLIRNFIPPRVRLIAEMTVISTMVILVDQILKAYFYPVSKELSIFVGLIITNCIVLGRLEAYAMVNRPWESLLDALGNGAGYALIIIIVGFFRELFGSGSLLGVRIVPEFFYNSGYQNNSFMVLAPGAFIILALIIWIQRTITGEVEEE